MAFYEVYSHPTLIRYKTSVCTKATLFLLVVLCLTYISPLLVAYRSQGFWIKRSTYEEQPVVRFQYQTLVVASTNTKGDYVAWSTFSSFNNMLGPKLRIPTISVQEQDQNQDGKLDRLILEVQLPLKPEEDVYSVQLLLTFSYQLFRMSTVVMQSLAYIQYSSPVPGAQLFVSGDLRLQQRVPLPHRGLYNIYNVSVVDGLSPFASAYNLVNIIKAYQERNLWTVGRATGSPFQLSAEIRYPLEPSRALLNSPSLATYRPGFWETIKFAWIQYVSVLLVFLWVFTRVKTFVFQNQVLPTLPLPVVKPHLM
ncbi:hypothetical protein CRUP_007570 [Coryphaenoides rupestris]|nr:hypothetical protein CRUP_007570 [Coryphaenoides rupestris]